MPVNSYTVNRISLTKRVFDNGAVNFADLYFDDLNPLNWKAFIHVLVNDRNTIFVQ